MYVSSFFQVGVGKADSEAQRNVFQVSITVSWRLFFVKYALWNGSVWLLLAESYNSIGKIRGRMYLAISNATVFWGFVLLHWPNFNSLSVQSSLPIWLLLFEHMGRSKMKENPALPFYSMLNFKILDLGKSCLFIFLLICFCKEKTSVLRIFFKYHIGWSVWFILIFQFMKL